MYYNFSFLIEKSFRNLSVFITSYLSLLNSFLFLSRFSVSLKSLNNYFFRRFPYKSLLNKFSVLINYIMWSFNHFSTFSCFPRFSGPRFFRARVQVLEVAEIFSFQILKISFSEILFQKKLTYASLVLLF